MTLLLSMTELLAFLSGLIYVYYAANNDLKCWYWGILSCAAWIWVTVVTYGLYADGLLNFFYVVMGFVGLYQWKKGGIGKTPLSISTLKTIEVLWIAVAGIVFSFAGGYFLSNYTEALATYWDSATTVFSIIATLLLIRKKLENWPLWVFVNTAYIGLYIHREAWLFALLFVVYNILAVYGWMQWRRELRVSQ